MKKSLSLEPANLDEEIAHKVMLHAPERDLDAEEIDSWIISVGRIYSYNLGYNRIINVAKIVSDHLEFIYD